MKSKLILSIINSINNIELDLLTGFGNEFKLDGNWSCICIYNHFSYHMWNLLPKNVGLIAPIIGGLIARLHSRW
jgi:hypothetical protein